MNRDVLKGAIGLYLSQKFGSTAVDALATADEILDIIGGAANSASPSTASGQAGTPASVPLVQQALAQMQTQLDNMQATIKGIQSSLAPAATEVKP